MLLSPVAPTVAFRLGEQLDDPLQMYLNDIYTASVNLAGIPAISVPFAHSRSNLPIGVQLLAPPLEEARLLGAAHALERAAAEDVQGDPQMDTDGRRWTRISIARIVQIIPPLA